MRAYNSRIPALLPLSTLPDGDNPSCPPTLRPEEVAGDCGALKAPERSEPICRRGQRERAQTLGERRERRELARRPHGGQDSIEWNWERGMWVPTEEKKMGIDLQCSSTSSRAATRSNARLERRSAVSSSL